MTDTFPVHTMETAPPDARASLEAAAATFGFIPNLLGVMASSPALAESYLSLSAIFDRKTSLTPTERQVVLLAVSRYHECRYCMAAHSAVAAMQQLPADVVEAIRADRPISDPRLEALRRLATRLVEARGWLERPDIDDFLAQGYTQAQLLDVLVGVAQKTLSNFTNHLAATPLDTPMQAHAWKPGGDTGQL